ncbi:hypothetical protein conserved [Leishmania donovani]|uniref:Uncharacterized protein n=2 Tax=Leishmania donovani TaxID=5661 RepID=A0A504X005_LEIDO|nr:hypothetical protein CGC20_29240 [Leishmania donovani]CAJ1993497.1 hypothetical protein conserved [Leishmania donovani]
MQPGAEMSCGSYAAFHSLGNALRRPKSDYSISLEARGRSKKKIPHKSTSASSYTAVEQTGPHRSSPRWSFVRETAGVMQPATAVARRTPALLSTPRDQRTPTPQHAQTSPRSEQHVTIAGSDAYMDEAASALLSELQQVVVRVSHQMVEERRRAAQQRKQICALEVIVAEQEAMLDALRAQRDAAQCENSRLLKRYQQKLRWRGADPVQAARRSPDICGTSGTRVSAAQVDNVVQAEFRRLSTISEPCPFSGFDDVSPGVAAVLRSLATQVLQLQGAAQKDELEACNISKDAQPAPVQPHAASSSLRASARATSTSSLLPAFNRSAPADDHGKAGVVDRVTPVAALEKRKKASVFAAATAGPNYSPSERAGHTNGEEAELHCVDLDAGTNGDAHAAACMASEASASVGSSVYEDAASILSDIRARYGL